eukprot:3669274-Amphidinium_carterae.1
MIVHHTLVQCLPPSRTEQSLSASLAHQSFEDPFGKRNLSDTDYCAVTTSDSSCTLLACNSNKGKGKNMWAYWTQLVEVRLRHNNAIRHVWTIHPLLRYLRRFSSVP